MNINNSMCSSCIFGANSPIPDSRFAELEREWNKRGVHQECHQFTVFHEHVGCRGHYEAARRGEYPNYPAILELGKLGIKDLSAKDILQVAERLGLIRFVNGKEQV